MDVNLPALGAVKIVQLHEKAVHDLGTAIAAI
jgi:hypothetical protein